MKNSENSNDLSERLEKACEKLIYLSETDAEVEPFFGGKVDILNTQSFLETIRESEKKPVEVTGARQFFERVSKINDWHTASQKKNAEKFAALRKLLESNLSGLRIFRVGRIQIDIYIVGIDKEGKLAGVKTRSVET
ncbi:MAG: nuclease A inhibitor family protein [Pyrinomonadaceae bacterium]